MDRSWKSVRLRRRCVRILGAVGTVGIGLLDDHLPISALAQAPVPASHAPVTAGLMTWQEMALRTQKQGIPTVLIVTSKATPASTNLARLILVSPAVVRLKGKVGVAELCAEEEPEQVKRLKVSGYPAFVAFRRGKGGALEVAASFCGTLSADELSGWVRGLGLLEGSGPADSNPSDAGVTRAGLFSPVKPSPSPQYPSPQYAYPPPMPPAPPVPPPPPYVPREVYVEAPPPVEREVIIEREVVVEAAPREVYVEAAPREREIYIERAAPREAVPREAVPREAVPRNVLTRPAPREVTPRDVTPQPAPRRVVMRDVAPQPAPRQVILREAAPREAAPREVFVERAAPREVYVERAAAPRGITPRDTALIQPGPIARAVGSFGRSLARVGLPRVEVETETTYQLAAPREASVVTQQAAPPPVCAAPPPVYAAPPPPPPYAPSPQAYPTPYAPSPQAR